MKTNKLNAAVAGLFNVAMAHNGFHFTTEAGNFCAQAEDGTIYLHCRNEVTDDDFIVKLKAGEGCETVTVTLWDLCETSTFYADEFSEADRVAEIRQMTAEEGFRALIILTTF